MKGEFEVSEAGVGGSICANTSELVSEKEKGWLWSPCFGEGPGDVFIPLCDRW